MQGDLGLVMPQDFLLLSPLEADTKTLLNFLLNLDRSGPELELGGKT